MLTFADNSTSKIFKNQELVPGSWLEQAGSGPVHVFNPSILRLGKGVVMAYRVVLPDGSRRIAMCRLNDDGTVQNGSISAFSDMLSYADEGDVDPDYHLRPSDPRLFDAGGRLYMHFNSESQPTPNRIYLVAIEPNLLQPLGHAREVVRLGRRQAVEKNWLFFAHGGEIFVIYRLAPLTILRADLTGPRRIVCSDAWCHPWDAWPYEDVYGELRGGATPVRHDGQYFVIAHSAFAAAQDQPAAAGRNGLCYVGAMCVMAGQPPFAPLFISRRPVLELTPAELALPHQPQLDPRCAEIAYPDGACADDRGLTVSYGINNRYAALQQIEWADLLSALVPAIPHSPELAQYRPWRDARAQIEGAADSIRGDRRDRLVLRSYWWKGKRISPRGGADKADLAQGQFLQGNFGDLSAPHILGRLTGLAPQHHVSGPRLMSVGSILQFARDQDVIWGSGLKGGSSELIYQPKQLHVYATRGPISRGPISYDFLRRRGFDVGRVTALFDPASLVTALFGDEIEVLRQQIADPPRDFILIPHFTDDLVMRQLYPQYDSSICSVDTPFFQMVSEILRSNLVVSSSLHGLIVAEALGVHAIWHRPLMGEDELKFTDYYLGTDRHKIVRVDTLDAAFKVSPMMLPKLDPAAMLATFPSFDDLAAHGVLEPLRAIALGSRLSFAGVLPAAIRLVDGWSHPESHGVWSEGDSAVLELFIGETMARDVVVELTCRGFVPRHGLKQRGTVSDGTKCLAAFEIGDTGPVTIRFLIGEATQTDGLLRLTFAIPTAISPQSLGLSLDARKLGIALSTLQLMPPSMLRTTEEVKSFAAVSGGN